MNVKNNFKKIRWFLIFGLLGYFIYFLIFPRLDDFSNIKFNLNEEQATQKVTELSSIFAADLEGLDFNISLRRNNDLLKYSQQRFGLKQTCEFIKKNFPAYYWHAEFISPNVEIDTSGSLSFSFGGDQEESARNSGRRRQRSIVFEITTNGQLLSFEQIAPPDTTVRDSLPGINIDEVEKILLQISPQGITDWQLKSQNITNRRRGIISRFRWVSQQVEWTDSLGVNMDFRGKKLLRFNLSMDLHGYQRSQFGDDGIYGIGTGVGILVLSILIIFSLIRRLRQDKIDFKYSWIIAIITTISMIFVFIPKMSGAAILDIVLLSLLVAPFVGLFAFILTSVAESVARDVWNEKLLGLDFLIRARFHSPKLGKSLLGGLAFAGIIVGLYSLLLLIGDQLGTIWIQHGEGRIENFISRFPFFYNIGSDWARAVFILFAFVLFVASQLRNHIRNNGKFILLFSLIFALLPMKIVDTCPFYFPILINFVIGFLLLWILLRFDFVVAGVAFISALSLIAATPYLNQDSVLYIFYGVLSLSIPGIFLIIGLIGISSSEDPEMETEYVPPYLKRWRERERLHRELEIARTVQLKFLPQSKPDVKWLDVASICIPAYEIGGDYYDFVQLDDSRFGVIVGDVSGKGVSAAFYMTLMKGIFKSQTRHVQSPCEVLKQINDLFYENTQRGVFISMIYGVFDKAKGTFTFSRAGHNPLISFYQKKNQAEQLSPYGIAIGLDKGPIFKNTLEESEVKIEPGDIFVFYTDGYSEAMNKNHSECGEERIVEIVNRNSNSAAQTVLDKIQIEVDKFTGDSLQHDDMTMVVVRIR